MMPSSDQRSHGDDAAARLVDKLVAGLGPLTALIDGLPLIEPRGMVPANLGFATVDQCKVLMLDEGIPVAWVIPSNVMQELLAASDSKTRRHVVETRQQEILDECGRLIGRAHSEAARPYLRFAAATLSALRAGHADAAQALAANTLDRFVTDTFSAKDSNVWVSGSTRKSPDRLTVLQFFVVCQLRGIHGNYRSRNANAIPRSFNRHASVHAVSESQYSSVNAVLGVAHLVSALTLLDIAEDYRTEREVIDLDWLD